MFGVHYGAQWTIDEIFGKMYYDILSYFCFGHAPFHLLPMFLPHQAQN